MANRPNTPVPDHLADTGPTRAIRDADLIPRWRRSAGFLSLVGAVLLTIATTVLLLSPTNTPEPQPDATVTAPPQAAETSTPSMQIITPAVVVRPEQVVSALPTLSAEQAAQLLAMPVARLNTEADSDQIQVVRDFYNPFTIIPDRPRSEVVEYEVQSGDTIFRIAERFGLKPESIAWANDRSLLGGLRPGRMINILPVDGAFIVVAEERTIASIAEEYGVEPFAIIDSEYNDLFGSNPETVLESGTRVVIPGGVAEQITWTPRVERTGGDASRGNTGGQISFARGEPGSCGLVDNPGGTGGWTRPVAASQYQWSQGFTGYHSGVDLAGSVGTPIYAALGGTVIFAGWNNFGYGYAVVLAHGPYTTVYGHLSSINVRCAQYVQAGQVIGGMGASGQATGPHLHFEIRYNDAPQDPSYTIPF